MKFLLSKALIVAAVGIPAAAFSFNGHRQIVLSEDPLKEALFEEAFPLEENKEPETEWDLFSEAISEAVEEDEEGENAWWQPMDEDEYEDDYDSMDWNFPKPPPNLKDGFPHNPPAPPRDGPERPGRPGDIPKRPGDIPKRPGDIPKRPGDIPKRPGDIPKRPGDIPRRPGDIPRRPGDRPGPPGREPHQPGNPGCGCSPRFRFPPPPPPFRRSPIHRRPGGPPHRRFPCPRNPHSPVYTNKTIYELLSESKYTTKAFEIIKNDEELSDFFKNTKTNITLFVPTDKAFEKLPHHPHHNSTEAFSKDFLRKAVLYHTSPDPYDTKKLLFTKTIPSGLESEVLGKDNNQRLRISHSPIFGTRVNVASKIVAGNIFASNGVIHGVDNLIFLPPYAQDLVNILPTFFSTSALAFAKLELAGEPKFPEGPKTFFIPTNSQWRRLGFRINGFLFSKFGEKYLAALVKYHITHGKVVYSDYVITPKDDKDKANEEGHFHTELDTFLGDKKLTVDIWRKGPWTRWRINDKIPAIFTDVITRDGVLHVPHNVLIPPRPDKSEKPKVTEPFRALDEEEPELEEQEEGGELTIEDLMERLEPYL